MVDRIKKRLIGNEAEDWALGVITLIVLKPFYINRQFLIYFKLGHVYVRIISSKDDFLFCDRMKLDILFSN